jgi:hypothetical protein
MSTHEQETQEIRDAFDAVCRGRVEAAVKAEREACAKVCDEQANELYESRAHHKCAEYLAEQIRARGSK